MTQKRRQVSLPAPTGGWNERDPLSGMDSKYAVVMDNFFPGTRSVELRRGFREHRTGVGTGAVETLITSHLPTRDNNGRVTGSSDAFIACSSGNVYDITGETPNMRIGGFNSNRWQWTQFNGWLIMCNGEDSPLLYNGNEFSMATATPQAYAVPEVIESGLGRAARERQTTPFLQRCFKVIPFKNRLVFLEKDSPDFWYGGVRAVRGMLRRFPMGTINPSGGRIVDINTLTMDGGDGLDDRLCIFFESGDVAIYAGTDIRFDFGLEGLFEIGRVLGPRATLRLGGDLVVLTAEGYLGLKSFLATSARGNPLSISETIRGAVQKQVAETDSDTWEAVHHPRAGYLLVNVPSRERVQHVMNLNSKDRGWCRFTNQQAYTWATLNNKLYFGGDNGCVYEADVEHSDNGDPVGGRIGGRVQQAYWNMGVPARRKRFGMFKGYFSAQGQVAAQIGMGVNLEQDPRTRRITTTEGPDVLRWDADDWDVKEYGGLLVDIQNWNMAAVIGQEAGVRLEVSTVDSDFFWHETDITFEEGGIS